MPTGGVNAKNLMDYLSFDQILACGGTWMVNKALIEGEQWDEIIAVWGQAEHNLSKGDNPLAHGRVPPYFCTS